MSIKNITTERIGLSTIHSNGMIMATLLISLALVHLTLLEDCLSRCRPSHALSFIGVALQKKMRLEIFGLLPSCLKTSVFSLVLH